MDENRIPASEEQIEEILQHVQAFFDDTGIVSKGIAMERIEEELQDSYYERTATEKETDNHVVVRNQLDGWHEGLRFAWVEDLM